MKVGRRFAIVGAGALVLAVAVASPGIAGKKLQKVGASVQVTESVLQKGFKMVEADGIIQSSLPRCERQRSVSLYFASPSGQESGPAIGRTTSAGSTQKGRFSVTGTSSTKIKPNDELLFVVAQRKVKVKGVQKICKRAVSVAFPAQFKG